MKMNTPNALGFILAGLIMAALHWIPSVTGTRELWLVVMGGVLTVVGAGTLAQTAWFRVAPQIADMMQIFAAKRADARLANRAPAGRRVSI